MSNNKISTIKRKFPIIQSKIKTGLRLGRSSCINAPEIEGINFESIIIFSLRLSDLNIGELSNEDGNWHFKYCEVFKNQNDVRPIINFPNKEKEYESKELWPFFSSRIPGPGQPIVKELVGSETNPLKTTVLLLKQFGKQTIANPYLLEPMEM